MILLTASRSRLPLSGVTERCVALTNLGFFQLKGAGPPQPFSITRGFLLCPTMSCTSTCVPAAGLPCPATPCSQLWLERLASDRFLALAPLTLPLETMAQGDAFRAAGFRGLELSFDSRGFQSRRLALTLPPLLQAPTDGPPCIMFTHCLHTERSALSKGST